MKLIIFTAMRLEAIPIISRLKNTKKIKSGNLIGWQGTFEKNIQVQLFYTGIGAKEINVSVDDNSIIINIGIAGSLSNQFKIGDWFTVSKVNNINCNVVDEFKVATLITVNEPVKSDSEAKKLNADLVDMEGLFVAEFAQKNKLQCYILKMVSDFADENFVHDCKKSMETYNNTCFENLKCLISHNVKRVTKFRNS